MLALAACSSGDDHSEGDAEVLATGLEVPWGLAFLPSGDALVGERPNGRLYEIPAEGGDPEQVGTVPDVADNGEGGLLGLAMSPEDDGLVYAYLTTDTDNRIVRFRLGDDPSTVVEPVVVLDGLAEAGNHDGGAWPSGRTACCTPAWATPPSPTALRTRTRSTARSCG